MCSWLRTPRRGVVSLLGTGGVPSDPLLDELVMGFAMGGTGVGGGIGKSSLGHAVRGRLGRAAKWVIGLFGNRGAAARSGIQVVERDGISLLVQSKGSNGPGPVATRGRISKVALP